jgi:hypothetical protein
MEYSVKRTDYVKGTYKTFSYELKNDSLIAIRYSTNNLPPKILFSCALTKTQKSKLIEILGTFDLPNMQSEYVDNTIEGSGHSIYDIQINQDIKSIRVYFGDEPRLKKLDAFIDYVLPVEKAEWDDSY